MVPSLDEILSELEKVIEDVSFNIHSKLLTITTKDRLVFVVDPKNPSEDFLLYFLRECSV